MRTKITALAATALSAASAFLRRRRSPLDDKTIVSVLNRVGSVRAPEMLERVREDRHRALHRRAASSRYASANPEVERASRRISRPSI
mgnify:CR=1 FL=1